MNILISGGAGFIGSHLAARLLSTQGVDGLTVYDNFSSGTEEHLAGIAGDSRLRIIRADLNDMASLNQAMRGIDRVFHLAANPDIAAAVRDPDIDFREGTILARNVLEAMRLNGVRHLCYTSGSGVYGEAPGTAFDEAYGPCFPISTYGASKLACEALISSYCHMFSMRGRAFRFANVVGPRQTHGVGYDFVRRLTANPSELRILGDGSQCKSYIYVDDVLEAMLGVCETMDQGLPFDVFNAATDDYITVTEIADVACETCGLHPDRVRYEYTGGDRGWKGDVPQVLFNVDKLKGLGWRARYNSRQAIEKSLAAIRREVEAGA